jgi:hypothetical protein
VKAVAPPGKGYNLPVMVRVGGKDSSPYAGGFSYDGLVQSAHPLWSSIRGGTMLRIKGTGFRDDGATTYVCYFSAGSIAREISAEIESSSAIKCRTPDWPYVLGDEEDEEGEKEKRCSGCGVLCGTAVR